MHHDSNILSIIIFLYRTQIPTSNTILYGESASASKLMKEVDDYDCEEEMKKLKSKCQNYFIIDSETATPRIPSQSCENTKILQHTHTHSNAMLRYEKRQLKNAIVNNLVHEVDTLWWQDAIQYNNSLRPSYELIATNTNMSNKPNLPLPPSTTATPINAIDKQSSSIKNIEIIKTELGDYYSKVYECHKLTEFDRVLSTSYLSHNNLESSLNAAITKYYHHSDDSKDVNDDNITVIAPTSSNSSSNSSSNVLLSTTTSTSNTPTISSSPSLSHSIANNPCNQIPSSGSGAPPTGSNTRNQSTNISQLFEFPPILQNTNHFTQLKSIHKTKTRGSTMTNTNINVNTNAPSLLLNPKKSVYQPPPSILPSSHTTTTTTTSTTSTSTTITESSLKISTDTTATTDRDNNNNNNNRGSFIGIGKYVREIGLQAGKLVGLNTTLDSHVLESSHADTAAVSHEHVMSMERDRHKLENDYHNSYFISGSLTLSPPAISKQKDIAMSSSSSSNCNNNMYEDENLKLYETYVAQSLDPYMSFSTSDRTAETEYEQMLSNSTIHVNDVKSMEQLSHDFCIYSTVPQGIGIYAGAKQSDLAVDVVTKLNMSLLHCEQELRETTVTTCVLTQPLVTRVETQQDKLNELILTTDADVGANTSVTRKNSKLSLTDNSPNRPRHNSTASTSTGFQSMSALGLTLVPVAAGESHNTGNTTATTAAALTAVSNMTPTRKSIGVLSEDSSSGSGTAVISDTYKPAVGSTTGITCILLIYFAYWELIQYILIFTISHTYFYYLRYLY